MNFYAFFGWFIIIERNWKIYLFVQYFIDSVFVVVYNIQEVIFCCLLRVYHVQMLYFTEYRLQFFILFLQFLYLFIILNLYYFSDSIFETIDIVFHDEKFILDDSLLMKQFSNFT